jgi:hypothetical protein
VHFGRQASGLGNLPNVNSSFELNPRTINQVRLTHTIVMKAVSYYELITEVFQRHNRMRKRCFCENFLICCQYSYMSGSGEAIVNILEICPSK